MTQIVGRMPQPRLARSARDQVPLWGPSLCFVLPDGHLARVVWDMVLPLDLSEFTAEVKALDGGSGRPSIDPRVLLALWLYATLVGVGSARALAEECKYDQRYMWICGGLTPSYHILSDFRTKNTERIDRLFTCVVRWLVARGLARPEEMILDGTRTRACAGSNSFRTEATLAELFAIALAEKDALAAEEACSALPAQAPLPGPEFVRDSPEAVTRPRRNRKQAAQRRAKLGRFKRLGAALAVVRRLTSARATSGSHKSKKEKEKIARRGVRASFTDASARVMKMADGGFRPAHNIQVGIDSNSKFILGLHVTDSGTDGNQAVPMLDEVLRRTGVAPKILLADGGFATHDTVQQMAKRKVTFYAPPMHSKDEGGNAYRPRASDTKAVREWRKRMGSPGGVAMRRKRPLVEWIFARFKSWSLRQVNVVGHTAVRGAVLLHGLAHNLLMAARLGEAWKASTA